MISLWIPITIAAAFLQNTRSALQKRVKADLGTTGATFVRFGFGLPFALLYLLLLHRGLGLTLPEPNATFGLYVTLAGLSQIVATALLVGLFSARSFAVATTYSKTETVQTAVFGLIVLGESVSLGAGIGILVSLAGVLALSRGALALGGAADRKLRAVAMGLASGAFFGLSAVGYRAASLSLGGEGVMIQAGFTLACATLLQTLVMAGYMLAREPAALRASIRAWRTAVWVGLSGAAASACWFTAMTLQKAAYVRALGQIELLFTIAASVLLFRERLRPVEALGILLITAGILCLLLTG